MEVFLLQLEILCPGKFKSAILTKFIFSNDLCFSTLPRIKMVICCTNSQGSWFPNIWASSFTVHIHVDLALIMLELSCRSRKSLAE